MAESLDDALLRVRTLVLDADRLVRAVAAGRRRGAVPRLVRAELRPVALKAGARVQVMTNDGSRPAVRNVEPGDALAAEVDGLLAEPFGNWRVETVGEVVQVRVTKRGEAQVHVAAKAPSGPMPVTHDVAPAHLIPPDDPLFTAVGANAAKRRQVDAFVRALAATLDPEVAGPLRVVDLGCGNAYLTFAAYRYLTGRGLDVSVTGVDVRADQRLRNSRLASDLGWASDVTFVEGTILDAPVDGADLVLALHACDTATDEALARAVAWGARWVLAAPCCHHDVAAQLRRSDAPLPYGLLTRHGILRERFADVLTDALRSSLLRLHGYRVDVVEFVDSAHTPRNLLLRATRTDAPATEAQRAEYESLTGAWSVVPRLEVLLREAAP
jgi:SAM-dependent methyltransferase